MGEMQRVSPTPLSPARAAAIDLLSLTPERARAALAPWLAARGEPGYRLEQIVERLWRRPVAAWQEATELPAGLRRDLTAAFPLARLQLAAHQVSRDGTEKYLWDLGGGAATESVSIPEGKRRRLCLSPRARGALGCAFAATGRTAARRDVGPAARNAH